MTHFFNKELSDLSTDLPCVLIGGTGCFKSALLLHYAYLRVQRFQNSSDYGVIVCSQTKLDRDDRLLFGREEYGICLEASSADKIKLKYIEDYSDLCKYLAAVTFQQKPPAFLFLDDINCFADNNNRRLAHIMFLLSNQAEFMANSAFLSPAETSSKQPFFRVLSTWLAPEVVNEQSLIQQDGTEVQDVNNLKIKQACLVFKQYTTNLLHIGFVSGSDGEQHEQKPKLQIARVDQSLTTLKMTKLPYQDAQIGDILQHINSLFLI